MKLLILHASAGGGHRRAAEALEAAARIRGFTPVVRDILDFMPPLYRRAYARGYLALVRSAPELWGYLYTQTDRSAQAPVERRVRTAFNQLNSLSFLRFLKRTAPDAVICTHFLPLELVAALPAARRPPLFAVVTDFAVHSLWFSRHVDAYYVATEEARRQLLRKGQPPERITRTGIPVLPEFAPGPSQTDARRGLGLDPNLPVLLVLNGGLGIGPAPGLLQAAARTAPPARLVIVAGRNPRFERRLRTAAARLGVPADIHGFVGNLHDYMDAADLILSKPGGLTMAECLAKGKPVILMDPIPGQEQRNAETLLEAGCAVRAFDPDEALWKAGALLADPVRLAALAARARALGTPRAAGDILGHLRDRLP